MNITSHQDMNLPRVHPKKHKDASSYQTQLVIISVALVTIVWTGVLVFFAMEIVRRLSS